MSRMQEKYKSEVAPALMAKFGYKSVMQIPKLEKLIATIRSREISACLVLQAQLLKQL